MHFLMLFALIGICLIVAPVVFGAALTILYFVCRLLRWAFIATFWLTMAAVLIAGGQAAWSNVDLLPGVSWIIFAVLATWAGLMIMVWRHAHRKPLQMDFA